MMVDTRHRQILLLAGLISLLWIAGCGPETSERWNQSLTVSGPLESANGLVYVNETLSQVNRLRPHRSGGEIELAVDRSPTGDAPAARALSADGSTLYLVDDEKETLQVYDLSSDQISRTVVELDSAYDRLSVDPEGEFLLLSFGGSEGDYIARNVHELGIVDLRDGVSSDEEIQIETLASEPNDIVFAPAFELDGQEQRLAAVLSESEVTVVDLLADNPDDRLREVPLTISQADRVLTPTQALFDVTPEESSPDTVELYVSTDTGSDIVQVAIQPSFAQDAPRKFDVSVNQLAAGRSPVKMALLELDVGTRLLAIDSTQPEFTIIDIASGESATFDLPMTAPARDLMVYRTVVEGEPEIRVLVWSERTPLVSVIRPESIAVASDTPTVGRSVEAIRLGASPTSLTRDTSTETERAIVRHDGGSPAFSVLNLRTNRPVAIEGESLGEVTFSGPLAYGVFRNTQHFGIFDLETGHPTTYELPYAGDNIFVDEQQQLITVEHRLGGTGSFTVVDASGEPSPETSTVFEHVFLRDLFEQEMP